MTWRNTRPNQVLLVVALLSVLALYACSPVGFIAIAILCVIIPPFGRTLSERFAITSVLLLGVIAIAFPRSGSTPITFASAHLALSMFIVILAAARFIAPNQRLPRPHLVDGLIGLLGAVTAVWLMSAYIGKSTVQMVSGLFFTGWDNQGHFVPFSNTYEIGSTTWPTVDGSIAWNQWYPSLHTTTWALAQLAFQRTHLLLDRPGLLWPYVQWTSITFGACLAALAWVAADLSKRLAPSAHRRWVPVVAVLAMAAFGLLGSPTLLFNAGFNNFFMGIAVVVTAGYLAARSRTSACSLGWWLVPLAALAANALWTPLVLALIAPGAVVLVALWQHRRWTAPIWAIATVALIGGTFVLQSRAILKADPGSSATSFAQNLGAVGTGMVSFNVGAAIAAPMLAIMFVIWMIRSGRWMLGVAVGGPVLGFATFLVFAIPGALSAHVQILDSYYVLKILDGLLLGISPLLAAGAALVIVLAIGKLSGLRAWLGAITVAVLAVSVFGYAGPTPVQSSTGFALAPGIAAGDARDAGVHNSLVGEAIIGAASSAQPYPTRTPMLWDGAGTLVNLWVDSLHQVMSKQENGFYAGLPQFPYDAQTNDYVKLALNADPTLNLAILWFRGVTGPQVTPLAQQYPMRVITVKVPMRASDLCPECSLP